MVLPLLKSDLLEIMLAVAEKRLDKVKVEFSDGAACCVVMASEGYPKEYDTGFEISMPQNDDKIYVAGAKIKDGMLVTAGGRVLGAVETADTLKEAVDAAYEKAKKIKFENAYYRTDIGKKALEVL